MKHLQSFQLFEAHASVLTPDQEAFLNACTHGTWSVNPETGLVDVNGDFDCSKRGLKSLQGVSFGHVSGDFFCSYNQLTTLVGAPQTVDEIFACRSNQLTSLEGAPQTVGGSFWCDNNLLTTLEGAPQTVDRLFSCCNNQLITLEGAPQMVGGNFRCENNQLTTLEGAPQTVGGRFCCDSFALDPGEWIPSGWAKILSTGNYAARRLILTLPIFDPDRFLQKLSGDLKKDGQVLLQLAALWEEPDWAEYRREIEQRLSPEQLRAIKVLRTRLGYVNPWQGGVLTDI